MNNATTEDIVRIVEFDGEEWLYFKAIAPQVALTTPNILSPHPQIVVTPFALQMVLNKELQEVLQFA